MSTKLNISIAVDSREEAELATKAIGEAVAEFRTKLKDAGHPGNLITVAVDIVVAPPPTTKLEAAKELRESIEDILAKDAKIILSNISKKLDKLKKEKSKVAGLEFTATDPKVIISDKGSD